MNGGETGAGGEDLSVTSGDFPVYLVGGRPSFAPVATPGRPRVLVISLPKSGTYLMAAFLKELGLIDTGVHLDDDGFCDYRNRTIEEMVAQYREFRKLCPLSHALALIHEGQFAVGHLACNPGNITATADFAIFFLQRELRSALISMMRFMCRPGRGEEWSWKEINDQRVKLVGFLHDRGSTVMPWFASMLEWACQPAVWPVRFEDLIQRNGAVAKSLAARVGVELSAQQASVVLDRVLAQPTKTWSGNTSQTAEYWSEEAESIFRELGGPELNERLGYAPTEGEPFPRLPVTPIVEELRSLLTRLQNVRVTFNRELQHEQARNRVLQQELATQTAFSWPNLCRAAAQAIERCRQQGYRSVAFYGAGEHTSRLLPIWEGLGGPTVVALLVSENPGGLQFGLPVILAGGPIPPEVEAVVPSSHTHEPAMQRDWLSLHPEISWVPLWGQEETVPEPVESHD